MRYAVNTLSVIPGKVGGGETYLVNLVRALSRQVSPEERLLLLLTRGNQALFADIGENVERFVLPLTGNRRAVRLAIEHLALPFLLRALEVDVLLSPGNSIPLLSGVRHVLALQSMHYRFVPDEMARSRVLYFQKMVPLAASRAYRTLCMSRDLEKALLEVAPRAAGRTRVVYEGAELGDFSPQGEAIEPGGYLLYVSSLNRFKRPDSAVRAVAKLRQKNFEPPPLKLVGRPDPADRERIIRLAEAEGVKDLVEIVGVVPHSRLAAWYRGAAMLIYPSAVETFGLPPLEAMACGCPVVASNRTSVPEITGDGAINVDPDDIASLAGAIRGVLTRDNLRWGLRVCGFANVRRFTWEEAGRRTLAALREAVRRTPGELLCRPSDHG